MNISDYACWIIPACKNCGSRDGYECAGVRGMMCRNCLVCYSSVKYGGVEKEKKDE
jgi:hypothetical protein